MRDTLNVKHLEDTNRLKSGLLAHLLKLKSGLQLYHQDITNHQSLWEDEVTRAEMCGETSGTQDRAQRGTNI